MIQRLHITICGTVQGIGFRPFVYKLAQTMNLPGWIENTPAGVLIEIEGRHQHLEKFILRLQQEKPDKAFIQSIEFSYLDPVGISGFQIQESQSTGKPTALILPDIATCPACLEEVFDPNNRRYLYPFTNCTNCGPRFSIIESLPYDRPNTAMKHFTQCSPCQQEYENPKDRRFHAQPNACSACGPHVELWNLAGDVLADHHHAIQQAVHHLKTGSIVAIKGIGGFQLMVDAQNEDAVQALRQRKHREEKPFALMLPTLETIQQLCSIEPLEERLLCSAEAPIVLLQQIKSPSTLKISASVAPDNPYLGVMLPYSPLHHILSKEANIPLVATSGNRSDEPICISEKEALSRLNQIADFLLVHNRPILRHVDDSIARIILDREQILRRSRGYAPLPVMLSSNIPGVLAVGGQLKNTIAITQGSNVFISQHIGDLETAEATHAFEQVIADFQNMYQIYPQKIISDLHPGYTSTKFAVDSKIPFTKIQHHYAHIASCMAENGLNGSALGICWDGTGLGTDGTIWGGEFLSITEDSFQRFASLRPFPLPGGAKSIKEPKRTAIGMLHQIFQEDLLRQTHLLPHQQFTASDLELLLQILKKKLNSPYTSSMGRLFDAVASIIGLCHEVHFEGQAAMKLEFITDPALTSQTYSLSFSSEIDWQSMILEIIQDQQQEFTLSKIATKFHNTLANLIVEAARQSGEQKIVLSGGCFQNRYLTEQAVEKLRSAGFQPYWHQRIPPNDGGISLGQIYAHLREPHHQNHLDE
ncbi:MAG: carbamoyltransferase HypF [SAR324 cluster bacterium]|nr:carbamoyltransferase HypF [SAR324 cluster bacterium]